MKFLSLLVFSGLLTVSCSHWKKGCDKDHCDKDQKMSCCKQEKENCKDDHCKKDMKDCKDESCKKEEKK